MKGFTNKEENKIQNLEKHIASFGFAQREQ